MWLYPHYNNGPRNATHRALKQFDASPFNKPSVAAGCLRRAQCDRDPAAEHGIADRGVNLAGNRTGCALGGGSFTSSTRGAGGLLARILFPSAGGSGRQRNW